MSLRLFTDSNSGNQIKAGIAYLQSQKLATQKNCAVIESSPEYGLKLAYAICAMHVNAKITDENLKRIQDNPAHCLKIAEAIYHLMLGEINVECHWPLLLHNLDKINCLASDYVALQSAGLLTNENKQYICKVHAGLNGRDSLALNQALSFFKLELTSELLTQERFERLCQSPATSIITATSIICSADVEHKLMKL